MAQDARISSRINADLKSQGDAILSALGIKPSQAITMFYTQVVKQRGLPFEVKMPNDKTIRALQETDLAHYPDAKSALDDMWNKE